MGVAVESTDDSNQQQQFDNTLRNFAVEVLPIVPDCPLGEHSRIQVIEGVEVAREATITFQVAILEQCVQACRISTYADGSRLPLLCRSAHFNRASRQCSVYSDAINPNGYLEYKPNQNVIYIEKICIPGHASEVISVASENECVLECIKAKTMRSVACHSVLHYPDFSSLNCILNVHTRHTKNQYFTPELAYKVDYVELGSCVTNAASADEVAKSRLIEAEKKLLQQLDANPTVVEFPQKVASAAQIPKNSVEFFGPPQAPSQPAQPLNLKF
ncbi:hypothetical protein GCK72_023635 [Caenorhabditis remanei]|uniref:Apple domain-containing protein n=1 Tax=Caenorhabditis remanei TaxID=31234 RepID=A0A6A5FXG6_CAERE|nr:hypothetical protein GCK72_023635 [Caenorhabditis remanei]KAF1747174.1 hypothetical protein GCK72_023635 [Caenorhabditis remanei]